MQSIIEISNLQLRFNDEVIYKDFSFRLEKGEKLAISGDSGKGKSTLLHLLAGFIPDYKGEVSVNGMLLTPENVTEIRNLIAWLPQETALQFKTVKELFYAVFEFEINKELRPNKKEVAAIFETFDLSLDLLAKKLNEISGGQKQRIILASCILLKKPLLLLDEPTSALDTALKKKITDYILSLESTTVIAVTHDSYWITQSPQNLHLE